MRNPSPPKNSLAVLKITSSSLLSKTWGFFMKITLVLLLKLLRVNAVTLTKVLIVINCYINNSNNYYPSII
ncbi:MAG: hypothetical protein ACXWE6_12365 [Nitrososphaeraceae archaeon]